MRAVTVPRVGDENVLRACTARVPTIATDECLVRNRYAGLNFIDTYHRSGLYARDLPFVAGQEGGGVIAAVGARAAERGATVGDRVVYGSTFGSYAEYTAVPYHDTLDVPDDVSLAEATALCVQGLTAHYLVSDAHCGAAAGSAAPIVVVHAAAGGTGALLVQLAHHRGMRVIATASSESKRALARECGAAAVLSYDAFAEAALGGGSAAVLTAARMSPDDDGVRCVFDGVGLATHAASLAALGVRGCAVFFGNASGPVPPIDPLALVSRSLIMTRPKLPDFVRTRSELAARGAELFGALRAGALEVRLDLRFALHDAAEAHRYIAAGATKGKVLFDVLDCSALQSRKLYGSCHD